MARVVHLTPPCLPKNPTQTFRDYSINIIVENKVLFNYIGKHFANKINRLHNFQLFIIIRVTHVANTGTHSNLSLAIWMAVSNYKAAAYTCLHTNTLMLLYKSAKNDQNIYNLFTWHKRSIYSNRTVKHSKKAFSVEGASDSAITHQY